MSENEKTIEKVTKVEIDLSTEDVDMVCEATTPEPMDPDDLRAAGLRSIARFLKRIGCGS